MSYAGDVSFGHVTHVLSADFSTGEFLFFLF